MGLDSIISRSPDEVVLTPEDERTLTEPGIDLCGGVFSNGVTSFRGKVCDLFVSEVTGVSLSQEWIPPETLAEMADKLTACDPDTVGAQLDFPERLRAAGLSWEKLSGWLNGPMDQEAREAIIPSMGHMALLRNLRNFDDANVSDEVVERVAARLCDPDEVGRSRQFPIRFYSAWNALQTMRWDPALEKAVDVSLRNVPSLKGRTLILVDVSGSMTWSMSGRSSVESWKVAALFGSALAARSQSSDVYAYSGGAVQVKIDPKASVLRAIPRFSEWDGFGDGTQTLDVLVTTYDGHDRVVIITDEQAFASDADPSQIAAPIYTFNMGGHGVGHLPFGERARYTFGGLSDQAFVALEILDGCLSSGWPF